MHVTCNTYMFDILTLFIDKGPIRFRIIRRMYGQGYEHDRCCDTYKNVIPFKLKYIYSKANIYMYENIIAFVTFR